MSVEIKQKLLIGIELEDILSIGLLFDGLVMSNSGLKLNDCISSGCNQGKMCLFVLADSCFFY